MMKKFPTLQGTQVAVLRAAKATGVVLDVAFTADISDSQERFTTFENIEEAIAYIANIATQRNDVECHIYDKKAKIVVSRE